MNERDVVLLKDMLDAARKIQAFVQNKERPDLMKEEELRGFAVVKAVEVIGEAANHVSSETRAMLPAIAWNEIIGMRNRLIHAYNAIDYDIVWDVASVGIPKLISELQAVLE